MEKVKIKARPKSCGENAEGDGIRATAESEKLLSALSTSRKIQASAEEVFASLSHPERLSRWWGPAGFTNTFDVCEFKAGGRWLLTMHGPDGKNYPNESVFVEIEPPRKVVIEHVSKPKYLLTILLEPSVSGTTVFWRQVFENSKFAESMREFLMTANEQNLDRLSVEVLRQGS